MNGADDHDVVASSFDARLNERSNRIRQSNFNEVVSFGSLEMRPSGPSQPHERIPNTPCSVALISFVLGGIFFLSLQTFVSKLSASGRFDQGSVIIGKGWWWATPQLGFFLAAWSLFHLAEFAVTAGWNRQNCSVDSFLLDNGAMYHVAHGAALTEYLLSVYFFPSLKAYPYISIVGVVATIIGQVLRSVAMIHAATNFSHHLAFEKEERHRLVTDGIYAWFRHPSYAGFFYWALGTQLVLQNPISFLLYSIVLWRFFGNRIRVEEASLIRFFGNNYLLYRKRIGTKMPFIS